MLVNLFFPQNRRLKAYWTETDEYSLAENLEIAVLSGNISVKPIYIQFYETGELQSIAFWSDETVFLLLLQETLGQLMKMTIQKALDAEMENYLGYEKHSPTGRNKQNSRNGYSCKTVKGDSGELEIEVPRDRESEFEPQIVKKGQRRLLGFDDKIITLYAKGQTTRDIADTLQEMYGVEVSHTLISHCLPGLYCHKSSSG